jgi:glycosyltransferase involved in cell wall biosynthesis
VSPSNRDEAPTLSIALPVYNGERYLREALDSLLAQTFSDFELLVLDNASTDATAAIAQEYAARDPRVRYERNRENVGAARNFNLTVSRTSGRYFKWAAHDDLLDPAFLERCVAALDKDPGVVLAYAKARTIDEYGAPKMDYDPELATDSASPAARVEALLTYHKCFQIFGVIRRDALEQTNLIGLHAHGDGVLLVHLALLGRFAEIPDFHFFPRQHETQSSSMIGDYWSYARWFDPTLAGKKIFPHWRLFGEYLRVILAAPLSLRDRAATLAAYARMVRLRYGLLRGDIMFYIRPRLVAVGVPERLLRRSTR